MQKARSRLGMERGWDEEQKEQKEGQGQANVGREQQNTGERKGRRNVATSDKLRYVKTLATPRARRQPQLRGLRFGIVLGIVLSTSTLLQLRRPRERE